MIFQPDHPRVFGFHRGRQGFQRFIPKIGHSSRTEEGENAILRQVGAIDDAQGPDLGRVVAEVLDQLYPDFLREVVGIGGRSKLDLFDVVDIDIAFILEITNVYLS